VIRIQDKKHHHKKHRHKDILLHRIASENGVDPSGDRFRLLLLLCLLHTALPLACVPDDSVIHSLEEQITESETHAVALEVVTQRDGENALHDAGALCALVPLLTKRETEEQLILQNDLEINKETNPKNEH